jgi:hypothetical protein
VLCCVPHSTGHQPLVSQLVGHAVVALAGAANIQNPNRLTPEQVPIQDLYNTKVIQIAFLVACMYTASGLLGLGWIITRFLSHPTIAGFTSGAAVIIGLSQVRRHQLQQGHHVAHVHSTPHPGCTLNSSSALRRCSRHHSRCGGGHPVHFLTWQLYDPSDATAKWPGHQAAG